MALTPNLTTITVEGTYVDLQGNAIAGQVKFTPRTVIIDVDFDQIIIPNTITVTLDATGSFSVDLPATDDPDLTPIEFTYKVEEAFSGGRIYDIALPSNAAGGTINLADVVPALESSGTNLSYVSTTQYSALNSRVMVIETVTNTASTIVATINTASADATTAANAATAASQAASDYVTKYIHPFLLMGV